MHLLQLPLLEQITRLFLLTDPEACTYALTGVTGECRSVTDCAADGKWSTPGLCHGPDDIQCCTDTLGYPSPVPATGDVSSFGLTFIESFEGWSKWFYNDQAGHKTIGWGHKCEDDDCGGITEPLSDADGEALLHTDAAKFVACVNSAVDIDVAFNQNQFDALVDFGFNEGCVPVGKVGIFINSGDLTGATNKMKEYNKITVNGSLVVSRELVKRRAIEVNLFNS